MLNIVPFCIKIKKKKKKNGTKEIKTKLIKWNLHKCQSEIQNIMKNLHLLA